MKLKPLHIDFETRSAVDLRSAGLYRYFEDPTTDILCMAYAFGDEEPLMWIPGEAIEPPFHIHIRNGGEIIAWNAAFERQGFEQIMGPRYGFPVPKLEQYRCTMAEAYAMALPGSLDQAAPAIGLDIKKDNAGYRLMMKMCKPRLPRKGEATDKILWHETEEDKQRLYEYCKQDVRVEQAIAKRVLRLTDKELKIFQLDALINDRGVHIDKPLCEQAKRIVLRDTQRLDDEMRLVTKGAVASGSAVSQLCDYLQDAGVPTASVAKDVITDLLILDIPNDCRRALEIRKEVAKTSTAKIDSMLSRVQSDGRMRGNLQYHGVAYARWSARGAQLQNLPRPEIIKGDDESFSKNYELAISTIMSGSNVLVDMLYGKPLTVVADCIRGMITAAPGNDLLASDFSNIEGRVVAWLAGQDDKLDAFRAFDSKTGPDLYLVAAGGIFGVETEDAKPYRHVGKTSELACIAEGQLVTTDVGLIPIEKVTKDMKVWDGLDFVHHDGVVYRGIRGVITYDGLTATADHIVFTQKGQTQLEDCAREKIRLIKTGPGRRSIRMAEDHFPRNRMGRRVRQERAQSPVSVYKSAMHRVQREENGESEQHAKRKNQRLSTLFAKAAVANMALQKSYRYETALPEQERQGLEELRRPRNSVQVRFSERSSLVDRREFRASSGKRNRSYRQQWPLRTGESKIFYEGRTDGQYESIKSEGRRHNMGTNKKPIKSFHDTKIHDEGKDEKGSNKNSYASSRAEKKELARHPEKIKRVRVYDIINSGPRNRFTVSGCLVHNCGYQGGAGAFAKMAKGLGFKIGEHYNNIWGSIADKYKEASIKAWPNLGVKSGMEQKSWLAAKVVVEAWRDKNAKIKQLWYDVDNAAIQAVTNPGDIIEVGKCKFKMSGSFLWCLLPSGRANCYPFAQMKQKRMPWSEDDEDLRWRVTYKAVDQFTRQWKEQIAYGGSFVNHMTQGTARDLMAEAMLRAEAAGYKITLTVHDEILAEVPKGFGSLEEFQSIMTELPSWATGLPVSASGWRGERYRKG